MSLLRVGATKRPQLSYSDTSKSSRAGTARIHAFGDCRWAVVELGSPVRKVGVVHPAFQHNHYLFRRKVFKLFGGAFHVYDESGNLLFYSKQKAFKLREDFRVYSGERQAEELLTIKTPQILDIGATYNVQDTTTGEAIGAIRRKGLKSMVKDEWIFLSNDGREMGRLTERSIAGAFLSRFISLVPQTYVIVSADGREIAEIKQHFNPFVLKYTMRIVEPRPSIDRRLLISSGILLAGIERRQR